MTMESRLVASKVDKTGEYSVGEIKEASASNGRKVTKQDMAYVM